MSDDPVSGDPVPDDPVPDDPLPDESGADVFALGGPMSGGPVHHDTDIRPVVDLALVADAVQVARGKLFILGGGWNTLLVPSFPVKHPSMAVAVRVRIPWSWTGRPIDVKVDLEDGDGRRLFPNPIHQKIQVRKPEGMPVGSDVVVPRAFTISNLTFEAPGGYAFVITLDDVVAERIRFSVLPRRS